MEADLPGHHSVDHDEERQGEDGHDDLPLWGEGHLLVHGHLDPAGAHAHHGLGGIPLHPGGVGRERKNRRHQLRIADDLIPQLLGIGAAGGAPGGVDQLPEGRFRDLPLFEKTNGPPLQKF